MIKFSKAFLLILSIGCSAQNRFDMMGRRNNGSSSGKSSYINNSNCSFNSNNIPISYSNNTTKNTYSWKSNNTTKTTTSITKSDTNIGFSIGSSSNSKPFKWID
ncbi:MAG: hypothetical protein GY830_06315 [Bacteroidetes bacterium]|nr:hypothetical protein [Bacteroidota bacterium]